MGDMMSDRGRRGEMGEMGEVCDRGRERMSEVESHNSQHKMTELTPQCTL